jgi:zinc finger protein
MDKIENEKCPVCFKDTLTLIEDEQDIPHFGNVFIMSMNCSSCGYKISDIESEQTHEPCKYEFTIENSKDLNIRVVKSGEATIKIPSLKMSVEPGVASEGYVSNVEGILQRFKKILESERDSAEEPEVRKKAKNLLKKLWKVECGDEPCKVIIEDPSGNSAIISEKSIVTGLKGSKKK